uniref:Caspase activity and apoptosis inhibitor 1 n=1 Tax=Athene cunicularia TaxID=194338 RepID=A0A663N8Z8_ATHCN
MRRRKYNKSLGDQDRYGKDSLTSYGHRQETGSTWGRKTINIIVIMKGKLLQEAKCSVPPGEKVEEVEQPSDIEEGGLDLSVSLKPVSFYIADKKEMLQQCFCVIGEKKLQKMLPDILKNCSMDEIKRLCLEQLELLSEKKLLKILEGMNETFMHHQRTACF